MESNLDSDCVVSMEEIDLVDNNISCTYICRLSDSKLVGVDCSISSVCPLVTYNMSIPENTGGDGTRVYHVAEASVGCSNASLFGDISNSFRLESTHSIEEATDRLFRLDDIYVLSHLKMMAHQFSMKWNFVTIRSGRRISCNRAKRYVNR